MQRERVGHGDGALGWENGARPERVRQHPMPRPFTSVQDRKEPWLHAAMLSRTPAVPTRPYSRQPKRRRAVSYEAVQWAIYEAPMLLMPSGQPDVAARFVLLVRAERAGKDGRGTYAGHADVRRATGYDTRTIQRAERRLEEAGLMVRRGTSHLGTPRWDLDLSVKSDGNKSVTAERDARRREQTAERVRRHRARQKAEAIETDVSTSEPVTTSEALRNGIQQRDVTASGAVCNGTHATRTTNEPPRGTTLGTTPGGAPPPDPRRPPSPTAPGTYSHTSLAEPLTQAQDQASDPLPHASAVAPVLEIRPGVSQEAPYWVKPSSPRRDAAIEAARAAVAAAQAARKEAK